MSLEEVNPVSLSQIDLVSKCLDAVQASSPTAPLWSRFPPLTMGILLLWTSWVLRLTKFMNSGSPRLEPVIETETEVYKSSLFDFPEERGYALGLSSLAKAKPITFWSGPHGV